MDACPSHTLIHDLLLLIINLSQVKDPDRILRLFIEGLNGLDIDIPFEFVPIGSKPSPPYERLSTSDSSFGCVAVRGPWDELPAEWQSVLRNAMRMLAILLENTYRSQLLSSTNERLGQLVQERTEALAAQNYALKAEIEERRSAERALRISELRLRQMAENLEEVFWLSTHDLSECLYLSTAFERVFQRPVEGVYGDPMSWMEAVVPEDREKLREMIESTDMAKAAPLAFPEYRIRTPDGQLKWIQAKVFPVHDEAGNVYRLTGVAADITERKQLEDDHQRMEMELLQSRKMEAIGRLAGGVAHDFNNMLTVIMGNVELARSLLISSPRGEREHGTLDELLTQIHGAGERSASLTRQLLTFSRKTPSHPAPVSVNQILRELESMLRRLIGTHIHMRLDLEEDLPPILIDKSQMEQVILNLVINARDAMSAGGLLTLGARRLQVTRADLGECPDLAPGCHVEVSVHDTGEGIRPENLGRVFEPFFSTRPMEKGTGLGLATVYGIVKQHDGHIEVRSDVAEGTMFRILLPCVPAQSEEAPEDSADPPSRGEETILICEDETGILKLAANVLESQGYRVLQAQAGPQALEAASREEGSIDLLLTDIVMPGMSGYEVATELRKQFGTLPVLYMSGYNQDDATASEDSCVDRNGACFLAKPFTPAELLSAVRSCLDLHASPRTA